MTFHIHAVIPKNYNINHIYYILKISESLRALIITTMYFYIMYIHGDTFD